MINNKKNGINPLKVAVAGTVVVAGAVAAVKLAKKENRDKVKKLINRYAKGTVESTNKIIDFVDKFQEVKSVIKDEIKESKLDKKLAKKV